MTIFLETNRLYIKVPALEDLDHQLQLQFDPVVMRYIGQGPRNKEEVASSLEKAIAHYNKHHFSLGSVFEKQHNKFIGRAGLIYLAFDDTQPDIEVGYALLQPYWQQGYATELTKALVIWAFSNLAIEKLVGVTHPENIASQHVLEKAGMYFNKKTIYGENEVCLFELYKADAVTVMHYDRSWADLAKQEMEVLTNLFSSEDILEIQHVGSTSVPNLAAKPIIDIQIAVKSLAAIREKAIKLLKNLHYVFWDENPDPTRLFFVKGMPPFGTQRTHHVHIVELNSVHWRNKILFRDYLRKHPEAVKAYEALKYDLIKEYPYAREVYTAAKSVFVNTILALAKQEVVKQDEPG